MPLRSPRVNRCVGRRAVSRYCVLRDNGSSFQNTQAPGCAPPNNRPSLCFSAPSAARRWQRCFVAHILVRGALWCPRRSHCRSEPRLWALRRRAALCARAALPPVFAPPYCPPSSTRRQQGCCHFILWCVARLAPARARARCHDQPRPQRCCYTPERCCCSVDARAPDCAPLLVH